ncbi:MAG: ABC transporter substrate-binding protein [Pseudomonadota bacterium]
MIGILEHQRHEIYDQAIAIIETKLREGGYSLRQKDATLEVVVRNFQGAFANAQAALEEFAARHVDAVLTIGSPAAEVTKPYAKSRETPLIAIGCFDPVVMGLTDSYAGAGGNVTGSCYRVDATEQIQSGLLGLVPGLRRLGVVYRAGELQSEIQLDEVQASCGQLGIEVVSYNGQSGSELAGAADFFLSAGVQAVFLLSDSTSNNATEAELAKLVGTLPTLGALETALRRGVLVGRVARWEELCERGAEMVLRVLEGTAARSLPVYRGGKLKTVFNARTARLLGLEPTAELMASVDEVLYAGESDAEHRIDQ